VVTDKTATADANATGATTSDAEAGTAAGGGAATGGGSGGSGSRYVPDWTAAEMADITLNTVGHAMSAAEFDAWVDAFAADPAHGGQVPWQWGPFGGADNGSRNGLGSTGENNLLDNLLALGESQRAVATNGYGSAVDATGNSMQDRAVTPDFWGNAWYNRYQAPTYPVGMGGQPWSFDQYQYLPPGFVPTTTSPRALYLQNSGAPTSEWYPLIRRPYYNYQPVVDTSGNGGGGGGGNNSTYTRSRAQGGARQAY